MTRWRRILFRTRLKLIQIRILKSELPRRTLRVLSILWASLSPYSPSRSSFYANSVSSTQTTSCSTVRRWRGTFGYLFCQVLSTYFSLASSVKSTSGSPSRWPLERITSIKLTLRTQSSTRSICSSSSTLTSATFSAFSTCKTLRSCNSLWSSWWCSSRSFSCSQNTTGSRFPSVTKCGKSKSCSRSGSRASMMDWQMTWTKMIRWPWPTSGCKNKSSFKSAWKLHRRRSYTSTARRWSSSAS